MAKILDKDPVTYTRERDGFVRDLRHFHDTRGTPFRKSPKIGGHEIDLYLLYSLVTTKGGWIKVNSRNEWNELFEKFGLPSKCVNSGVALKQLYLRYLDRYEKVHFLGEEADRGSDDDEESRHRRWSARALHSVPLNYNYHQHNITDNAREYNGLSTDLHKPTDYDRLTLSLLSPLPNEQDFAINVCTLLSNEGKHTLKLEKHPRMVDILLGHAGVFNHGSLRKVVTHSYSKIRKHPIHNFWKETLELQEYLDLTNEDKFQKSKAAPASQDASSSSGDECATLPTTKIPTLEELVKEMNGVKTTIDMMDTSVGVSVTTEPAVTAAEACAEQVKEPVATEISDSDSDCELFESNDDCVIENMPKGKGFKLKVNEEDNEIFCMKRTLGTQDYIGQRVLQVANVLRNLSFNEENIPILTANQTFLRFVLLCAGSRWNVLHQLGLDMLGNIATEYLVKDLQKDRITHCLFSIVVKGLTSPDRTLCISSLEVLNKLSQNERNEDVMLKTLEQHVYQKVCSFLTLHDVMLLIYTLECLYSLSSLGERACNLIVNVHGVIDTLVSLITVEGKSYGPKACIGMKLVETVSGSAATATVSSTNLGSAATAAVTATNVATPAPTLTPVNLATPIHTTSTMTPVRVVTSLTTTPVRNVQIAPQRLIAISSTPSTVLSPAVGVTSHTPAVTAQQLVQQQHAHQQAIQENEQFALTWLRATYEPCSGVRVEQQELYKQYLNSCAKIGRRGVIAPLHFPRCVRSVFGGSVGPNPMKPTNPKDPQYYEGIKVRANPLVITTANIPQSNQINQSSAVRRTPVKSPLPLADSAADVPPPSPASPILKAQLSAPPKPPRDSPPAKGDLKSQVMAHPHLSQALLGNTSNVTVNANSGGGVVVGGGVSAGPSKESVVGGSGQSSNSSLIKSLLATKVNECMSTTVGMKPAAPAALAPAAVAQDSHPAAQVTQRQQQQRLLQAQQTQNQPITTTPIAKKIVVAAATGTAAAAMKNMDPKLKPGARINGARILFNDSETLENHVSSSTQTTTPRKDVNQQPPPPLAPLSSGNSRKPSRIDVEDSDSTGNNSLASSTGVCGTVGLGGGLSSTEDGDNSLTSFEGILLNGIPSAVDIETPIINDDSNSKDSMRNSIIKPVTAKPMMLADLLEKKVEKKELPTLNGVLGKELRMSDKGLDLVENHIDKMLSKDAASDNNGKEVSVIVSSNETNVVVMNNVSETEAEPMEVDGKTNLKRNATEDIVESEVKRPHMSSVIVANNNNNLNGNADSPQPDSVSSSNGGDEPVANVSATAANLYAALAADALEDEDEEQLLQEQQPPPAPVPTVVEEAASTAAAASVMHQVVAAAPATNAAAAMQQMFVDSSQQQMLMTTAGTRQIIVSQNAGQQMMLQKTPVIMQGGGGGQQRAPMMLSHQGNTGQILVSGPQGQMQLVSASGAQPGQYVIQTGGAQGTYVVAQQQTAVVHGQAQTVLVAQTAQQQGTGSKTIIILQQQSSNATHHQKVVVTPQGQQVVVTQVPRPIMQTSSVSGAPAHQQQQQMQQMQPQLPQQQLQQVQYSQAVTVPATTTVIKTMAPSVVTQATAAQPVATSTVNVVVKKEEEDVKPPKPKVVRDYSSPFVCEWDDCMIETKFKSANEVYMHVCEAHCPSGSEEIQCLWDRCDNMKRKRFSLMTHLYDRHCNTEVMKVMQARRKQLSQSGKTEIPAPTPPTPHPGYAPDAAFHAIKRHALEFVNPKELQQQRPAKIGATVVAPAPRAGPVPVDQDDNEGPVTKSIRLTASLILRNLVIYSNNSRRYLRHYEPHLASVALSNVESSRTIAQVLYDMNDSSTCRR